MIVFKCLEVIFFRNKKAFLIDASSIAEAFDFIIIFFDLNIFFFFYHCLTCV